jgi:hypothetical protein
MSATNPVLGLSIYSLTNSLELYQNKEERHRFGAIILLDLAVEYMLKAKLYQINKSEFLNNRQEMGFADLIKDSTFNSIISDDEKIYLKKVHNIRNIAQHRASIPDSLNTREIMITICKFLKKFCFENFSSDILMELPVGNFRVAWTKITMENKNSQLKIILKEPLSEKYRTVKDFIRYRQEENIRGFLRSNYLYTITYALKNYCLFINLDPDQLIENANAGLYSPDESLQNFLGTKNNSTVPFTVIKAFYNFHKIPINTKVSWFKRRSSISEISTDNVRKLCETADLANKSWILANSYMGLKLGRISLLTVKDFRMANWDNKQDIYPVAIRREVSLTYDYTTFIGADAKNVLKEYFDLKHLSQADKPWGYDNRCKFSDGFRKTAIKAGIYEKGRVASKSLELRLRNALVRSGMDYEWVCYLFGSYPYRRAITKPLDNELMQAYEKAYPQLRVF